MSANGAIHANFIIEQKKEKIGMYYFRTKGRKRAFGSFLRVELLRDPERKKIK